MPNYTREDGLDMCLSDSNEKLKPVNTLSANNYETAVVLKAIRSLYPKKTTIDTKIVQQASGISERRQIGIYKNLVKLGMANYTYKKGVTTLLLL